MSDDSLSLQVIDGLSRELSARINNSLNNLKEDKDAYSPATWKMVNHCWGRWATFCRESGYLPLPVDIELLRTYLTRLFETLAASSVDAHLSAINFVQRNADLPSVTADSRVSLLMRRLRRDAVARRETTQQAIPLRLNDLRLVEVLYKSRDKMQLRRDITVLVTAYHTLLRESELARLRVCDISEGEQGTGIVYIAETKTNKSGQAEYRPLSRWGYRIVCEWIELAGLAGDDYLFCKVNRYGQPVKVTQPLSGVAIDAIFRRAYLALEGVPKEKERYSTWTGHSARVGAALDMAADGATTAQIMQAGGWAHENMVARYTRRAELADSAMIRLTRDLT